MTTASLSGLPALSAYATALLKKQQAAAGGTAKDASSTSTPATTTTDASTTRTRAELTKAPTDFRSTTARHALESRQSALGQELAAGLAKAGAKLSGAVSFSLGSDGQVSVDGSAADQATVSAWLKKDASSPSVSSRLKDVLTAAQTLSQSAQQRNAIAMAARYAGPTSNVMATYAQFTAQEDTSPAVLTLSGGSTTLRYPGSVDAQA